MYRILGRMIKNLHKLIFCLALVTFCFSSFTNFALAAEKQKTITCERHNAPSWFRPDLHPKIITNQKRTNWQLQHHRGPSHVTEKYIIFTSRNGSKVSYKCDGPAWEVAYGFMDDWRICLLKSKRGWGYDQARLGYIEEAKRRGLDCQSVGFNDRYASFSDQFLCSTTQKKTKPSGDFLEGVYDEVLKRGLKCGVGETNTSSTASPSSASTINNSIASDNARKAFLGVLVYDVTPDIATDFGLSKSEGPLSLHSPKPVQPNWQG